MKNKGFTLIELLVVVAIIGVLATVVLSSLGSARNKAKDVKIKSLMSQMRNQAELFSLDYGSYRGTDMDGWSNDDPNECTNSPSSLGSLLDQNTPGGITDLIKATHSVSSDGVNIRVFCRTAGSTSLDSWAFSAPLYNPEPGTTGWCVDSSGNSKAVNFVYTVTGLSYNLVGVGGMAICP